MMSKAGASIVLAVLLAAAALAAHSAGSSLEERQAYTDAVEPICKTNVLANKRIFKGVRQEVKAGKLKRASGHFFRAARAFGRTVVQIEAVPRPPADAARLNGWLALLRTEKRIVERIGRALRSGQKGRAESFSVELNRNSNKANNQVLGFGFDYCRIEPARFG